jgi:uncharacterized cysteine cluster protein YcgN (CxxCxxCC family)
MTYNNPMGNKTNLESLCRQCGLCCHIKIELSDGSFVIHPNVTCKYLTKDNLCEVYDNRAEVIELKICYTREHMIKEDYILVDGCPYTGLRPGYKAARMVSEDEFNSITLNEMSKGNSIQMQVAEILDDPNTYWKMINLEKE